MKKTHQHIVCIHLGSNLGDRQRQLSLAVAAISESMGETLALSRIYETEAWGMEDQADFLNQALLMRSHLPPNELLLQLLALEDQLGRIRRERWGPRSIDLDLLFFDNFTGASLSLTLPHPRMHLRRFVLAPLADICPDWKHPQLGLSVRELLGWCQDPLAAKPYRPQQKREKAAEQHTDSA